MVAFFDANNHMIPPRRYSLRERIGLRMGMIAHTWHDTFTGALLALAKALHSI